MSIKIFDGSDWQNSKSIKFYDGANWQPVKKALSWDGFAWVQVFDGQVNTSAPTLSWSNGTFGAGAGQTVSVSTGEWSITPDSYTYQWQKGFNTQVATTPPDAPGFRTVTTWNDITSATTNSYLLTKDEVGYFIRCKVIAVNGTSNSQPAYAAVDSSPLPPQRIANASAFVQQDGSGYINGAIRFFWDVSEGADGYNVWYQGPGIPYTEVKITGKQNNLFDKDFGDPDLAFLNGKSTLSISVQPYNDTSPALSWWRWATAIPAFTFTGNGQSKDILDLLPKKPLVTATATATTPYNYSQAISLNWTNQNITQTSAEVYMQYYNDETLQTELMLMPYNGTTTATSTYVSTGSGVETGPWIIRVYGTSRGFSGPWDGNAGLVTSAYEIPTGGNVTISNGNFYNGNAINASTQGWSNNPTSYSVSIVSKNGSAPTSISDGTVVASGTTPSYTITSSDVSSGKRFKAFATASNPGGTSAVVSSSGTAFAAPDPDISVYIPNFIGQTSASNGTNYTIYYAAGTGTSNQSLVGKIASQSPSTGTYNYPAASLPVQVSVSSYTYEAPAVTYVYTPNYVGTSTADGTYGRWQVSTNSYTGTANASLAGQIVSQSPIANSAFDSAYLPNPAGVSVNRYAYQAPGYNIYVYCVGTSGDYGGRYTTNGGQDPHPGPSYNRSYTTGTTSNPNLSGQEIISLLGIPNACYVPPFGFTPFGFTPFGFTPFGFTPFGFTPFGFTPVKSIGADTLIASKNPEGLVLAHNLSVGDILYSADIENLETQSGLGLSDYFANWSEDNPVINTNLETTIVGLSARIVDNVVVINGNKYSYSHYIMIRREGQVKFVKVYEVEFTDEVFSPLIDDWQPILELRNSEGKELVISINTEPYDIFFTDNAIVHDSHPFNSDTPGAISDRQQSLSGALEALYQEWKLSQENPPV
jgi:hypothetical protein